MPRVSLGQKERDRICADNHFKALIHGHVSVFGKGNVRAYVQRAFSMSYRIYNDRMHNLDDLKLSELRAMVKTCDISDEEILSLVRR